MEIQFGVGQILGASGCKAKCRVEILGASGCKAKCRVEILGASGCKAKCSLVGLWVSNFCVSVFGLIGFALICTKKPCGPLV